MTEEYKPTETKLNELLSDAYDSAAKEREVKEEVKEISAKPEKKEKPEIVEEQAKEPTEEVEPKKEATEPSENESEVVAPVSKAPDHWSAGAKAHWDKLDPVVRAEALKQVEFANKMQSRHAQERKKYEAIESVLEPQRNMLRANYGDESNGLKALFSLSDFASKDPRGFVQWFAQQRGIDLRGLTQNTTTQTIDPTITALQQRIEQLTQNINGFKQNQEQAVYSDIDRSFKEFSANPANKYLEEVREDMAFFIESGRANDWQTAYDMATKINPTVSELIEAEKIQAFQEKKRKESEEAANKARKAVSMNVKTNGIVSSKESVGSWTDTLNKTADKLMSA